MLTVAPIEKREAQALIVENHYLHRKTGISYAVGLYEDDEPVGVVTFGCPPSRHLQISACASDPGLVVELNRLWVHVRHPERLSELEALGLTSTINISDLFDCEFIVSMTPRSVLGRPASGPF